MATFFYILIHILLPIFLLIGAGFLVQRLLHLDVRTMTKLNMYVFIPALIFLKIYSADVTLAFFGQMLLYILLIQGGMLLLGETTSRVFKYPKATRKAFNNSLQFFNSGNYGIPLIDLVFNHNPMATTSQVFIMLVQNITTNTVGVFQASTANSTYKKALQNILRMPSLYVLFLVLLVKLFHVVVPDFVLVPLGYLSDSFVAIALLTLGVQLAEIRIELKVRDVLLSSAIRLIISPVLGFLLVSLLGIKGVLAQAMILGVSTPSAVNTAIIAREFDNEPGYASQIVFVSTLFSPITISTVVYLVTRYM